MILLKTTNFGIQGTDENQGNTLIGSPVKSVIPKDATKPGVVNTSKKDAITGQNSYSGLISAGANLGGALMDNFIMGSGAKEGSAEQAYEQAQNASKMQGGQIGSAVGATVGSIFGPAGTAVGGLVGKLGGSLIGGWLGRDDAREAKRKQKTLLKVKSTLENREIQKQNKGLALQSGLALTRADGTYMAAQTGGNFQMGFKVPKGTSKTKLIPIKSKRIVFSKPKSNLRANGGDFNIIPEGALHREFNGMLTGDKGIPVVRMGKGGVKKELEIERGELIFNKNATSKLFKYIDKFKLNKSDDKLIEEAGLFLISEILDNTKDYTNMLIESKETPNLNKRE